MNIYVSIGISWLKYIEETVTIKISGSGTEYVAKYTKHTKRMFARGMF